MKPRKTERTTPATDAAEGASDSAPADGSTSRRPSTKRSERPPRKAPATRRARAKKSESLLGEEAPSRARKSRRSSGGRGTARPGDTAPESMASEPTTEPKEATTKARPRARTRKARPQGATEGRRTSDARSELPRRAPAAKRAERRPKERVTAETSSRDADGERPGRNASRTSSPAEPTRRTRPRRTRAKAEARPSSPASPEAASSKSVPARGPTPDLLIQAVRGAVRARRRAQARRWQLGDLVLGALQVLANHLTPALHPRPPDVPRRRAGDAPRTSRTGPRARSAGRS
ncbi:uncharacterized protein CMC5_064820 [Chondromyces crocatus]|uniref:Uncharacterized protein n=1 Tax=Chondromyces crocatus TaxID=52 RepID=A0A0K1EN30_CHOCO|nr:uncharacterized protein CMC5_064820 [Chondromyces crocatus]